MPTVDFNPTGWAALATTIAELLRANPSTGIATMLIATFLFFGLIVAATWSIVRIIKSKQPPAVVNTQKFSLAIMDITKQISKLIARRDELSRKHERIIIHSVVRDQMIIVESVLEHVHSLYLISMSDKIRKANPHYHKNPSDFPAFHTFDRALSRVFNETKGFFRRIAKENHLLDKSEQEFFIYVGQQLEAMRVFTRRVFESAVSDEIFSVSELLSMFDSNWEGHEPHYRRILLDMREVAKRYAALVAQETAEYDLEWNSFFSNIPSLLINSIEIKN